MNRPRSSRNAAKEKANQKETQEKEQINVDVIVIDIGSGLVKVGWAGEDAPRSVFPTLIVSNQAVASQPTVSESDLQRKEYLVGNDAVRELHENKRIRGLRPVSRGQISDGKELDYIIDQCFKEIKEKPGDHPVLLTCPPLASRQMRALLAAKMFKKRVPALFIANSSVMALFSTGRTSGVVLEAGAGLTSVVPVFEGCALPYATSSQHLAGMDCARYLMEQFSQEGLDFPESQLDVVRDIMEKHCAVFVREEKASQQGIKDDNKYELPDETIIDIGPNIRFKPGELLFQPSLLPDNHPVVVENKESDNPDFVGVHHLCYNSILKCDQQLQQTLFSNLVLAGGTSTFSGFAERLERELLELCDESQRQLLHVHPHSQRRYAAWIGGSMFASLSTFHLLKYSRQEYSSDESIVHKKYF